MAAVCLVCLTALLLGWGPSVQAAPTISNLSLRGLQIGGTTTITIDGNDLLPDPRVLLPVPMVAQQIRPGATAQRIEVDVTLDRATAPGILPLRVANSTGVSNPILTGVDHLAQMPWHDQVESLPVALHGNLTGNQILRTRFAGKQGMRVVVDVESLRLASKLVPVVRLLDPRGVQLAWSPGKTGIQGDARCESVLPADGTYTVELHDQLYRGAAPGFFRLKIGDLHYADLAFPLAVQIGSKQTLTFASSSLPPATQTEYEAKAVALTMQPLTLAQLPLTGAAPRIMLSDIPELTEDAPQQTAQVLPQVPVAVSGRLAQAGEEDRYLLEVAPGAKLRFDVLARRAGAPVDGVLVLRGEQGNQLARNDDRAGTTDPGLDYTVPENVQKIVIAVHDLHKRGGEDFLYRISIRDLSAGDFRLSLSAQQLTIPAGGTQVVKVQAQRTGYNGPIQLEVHGLPQDVEVSGDEIAAGTNMALLALTAPAGDPVQGLVQVTGRAAQGPSSIVRVAQTGETPQSKIQPWLREDVTVSLTQSAPFTIAWQAENADDKLFLGSSYAARFQLTRSEGVLGPIRLRLLTSQEMPKKKVKKDNKETLVDDVERALRLEGNPTFGPDAASPAVNVLVPNDLPKSKWQLVLAADLLGSDNKTVVASTTTKSRSLHAEPLLSIQLSGEAKGQAVAGVGEPGTLKGTIQRAAGFQQPVTITLVGLPEGVVAPKVVIPADQQEFELPLQFPYETKAGELKNVKLVGTVQPDPQKPDLMARSNEVPVAVNIVAGKKPPAP